MKSLFRASLLTLSLSLTAFAQPALDLPRQSPRAVISQDFGYATVTVKYSRPSVNGRAIWGGLVPYGQVWRTGANEPTVIEFSRDVAIDGHALPAGAYGLFMLPQKQANKETWTFIFSRNTKGWGAYGYDAKDDALRVTVSPTKAAPRERMAFAFDDLSDAGTTLSLHWGTLKGAMGVTSGFVETARANIAQGLPNIKADDPYAWLGAARFYWTHAAVGSLGDVDRTQALEWVDKSIAVKPLFVNLWAKAQWLSASGRCAEALELVARARDAAGTNTSETSQLPSAKAAAKWCKK